MRIVISMFRKKSNHILLSAVVSVGLLSTLSTSNCLANDLDFLDTPNELIRMGKIDAKEKKHIEAIKKYSKAIKLSPVNHYAYFYRARSRKSLHDYQRAVLDYNYVIKLNPKSSKAYTERGFCLMKLDLPQRAIKDLNKAINLNDKNYRAFQYRSQIKYKLNDYQGALSDFNRVLKLKPNSSKDISKFLFPKLNLVKKKDPNKKAKAADTTINITENASGKFEQKDLAAINNKAAKAIKSGKFEQAVKILEPITQKNPEYDFARRNLTIAYNNFGLKLARNNTKESVDKFRYALYYTPTEVTARRNLNAVLKELGQKPGSHEARIHMGNDLLTKGELKLAFVEFTEALRLRNDPKVRRKLAEVCLELDNQKEKEKRSEPVQVAKVIDVPKQDIVATTIPTQAGPKINFTLNKKDDKTITPPIKEEEVEKPIIQEKKPEAEIVKAPKKVIEPAKKQEPVIKQAAKTTLAVNTSSAQDSKIAPASTTISTPSKSKTEVKKPAPTPVKSKLASLSLPPPATPTRVHKPSPTMKALAPKFSMSKEAILSSWSNHMAFGQQRFDEGDYLGAETSFDKAASLAEGLGGNTKELAMSLEKVAEIYIIHKKVSQAYSLLARALVILSKHHSVDDPRLVNLRGKLDKLSAIIDGNTSNINPANSTNIIAGE